MTDPNTRKLSCGHAEYANGHCANMGCVRYVSRCPKHAIARTGSNCNLFKEDNVERNARIGLVQTD